MKTIKVWRLFKPDADYSDADFLSGLGCRIEVDIPDPELFTVSGKTYRYTGPSQSTIDIYTTCEEQEMMLKLKYGDLILLTYTHHESQQMNFNHLSDDELLDYLDRYSDDPVMRRVVDILIHKQHGIISDLVAAGMDPQDWTFCSDGYNSYYPGQYITHLKNELEWEQDEREGAEQKIEDLKDQLKKLSLRTVTELLKQAQDTIDKAEVTSLHAVRDAEKARQENRELKEKLGMWNVLATE
jgi:hypothetical protein